MDGEESFEPMDDQAMYEDPQEIGQDDSWAVISAFFKDKGLVRQQLDSFNEFVNSSMQEIVEEDPIRVRPEQQYVPGQQPGDENEDKEHVVKFEQIYLSKPTTTEADGETAVLFPKEARLRNLT
jgi:DNA-directed RNA polymerase II subunit RPB2